MKKIGFILILCILSTAVIGCSKGSPQDHPASRAVEAYIDSTSSGQWDKVIPLLSGQALIETKKNISMVKHKEIILSKKVNVTWSSDQLAEVYADVTKNTPAGDDRVAYRFYLRLSEGNWKIYKTSLSDFVRPTLKYGDINPEAKEVIEKYLGLSTTEKRNQDSKYLAGRLLRVSLSTKQVQGSQQNAPDTSQKVISIKPVGYSEDYAIVEVLFEGAGVPGTAIVDLIKVNNSWKITQLEIVQVSQ